MKTHHETDHLYIGFFYGHLLESKLQVANSSKQTVNIWLNVSSNPSNRGSETIQFNMLTTSKYS